jgi:hypothetical protein
VVLGLIGYKQSGKSTAAEYLNKEYGFVHLNFKDGLIEEMKTLLPDTLREMAEMCGYRTTKDDDLSGHDIDKLFRVKPPIMRSLMQNYGTEVRRGDDKDYWIQKYLMKMQSMEDNEGFPVNFVTDDVRFINEADTVRLQGGVLVRIVREDLPTYDLHQSETEHENIEEDFTVEAVTGGHESLYKQLDSIIDTLKKNVD